MKRASRDILAWSLFDFANSAFTTVIVTTVFAVYFSRTIVPASGTVWRGETLWSWCNSISLVISAALAPILGALADARALKRVLLVATALTCIGATALLATTGPGDLLLAMGLFIVANVGFELGYVFYNGFLPQLGPPERLGRISGYGWATGYLGGLVSLAAALVPLRLLLPDDPTPAQLAAAARSSFLIVAAHFFVFSLPAFAFLRDRPLPVKAPFDPVEPFRQVVRTLGAMRRYSEAFKLILASLVYNDGLVAIFVFAGIYMSEVLRFSQAEVVLAVLLLNVPSAAGSFVFGFVSDRIGGKRAIIATLLIVIGSVAGLALTAPGAGASPEAIASGRWWFWPIAMALGLGVGANQSSSRGLMALLVPAERQAEFFGFFIFSGKLSSVAAPLTYGLIVQTTGSSVLAILSVIVFLVAGGVILLGVDEPKGILQAREPRPAGRD